MASGYANLLGKAAVIEGLDSLSNNWSQTVTYQVGTNVEYAVHVEFGTRRMPPRPYMRNAVESVMADADQIADNANSAEELVETLAVKIEAEASQNAPVASGNLAGSIRAERV